MENRRVACIDGDSIIYICASNKIIYDKNNKPVIDDLGNKVKENKSLQDCKNQVDNFIDNILNLTGSTHFIIALTVGKNHRYQIYPEYKANRKYTDKAEHFDAVKEYLITKWKAIYNNNIEADDICLICSKELTKDEDYAFISTPDKDILMLEGVHYNYKTNLWIETDNLKAYNNFWCSMIIGDSTDNIKGIPGKGPKYAEQLVKDTQSPEIDFTLRDLVFREYIDHFGELLGIQEFYKNYSVLKIRDKWDNFIIPELQEYIKVDKEENNKFKIDF